MSKHDEAVLAFQQGRVAEALRLLEELLAEGESSELWNDWGAVQLGAGDVIQAESGFVRAMALDPRNTDAAANLGLLLLGRGDSARAIPLLRQALPSLPANQQKIVDDLLAAQAPENTSASVNHSKERTLRVLVIHDTFPHSKATGFEHALTQLLLALRNKGDEVTFIAREAGKNKGDKAALQKAGIRTYENDSERLPCLGRDASSISWSFDDVLKQGSFDIVVLAQSFQSGISVPEQYLDDVRRHSAGARIAVFADQIYASLPESEGTAIAAFESAADWAMRQWETFERADVVILPNDHDAATWRHRGQEQVPNGVETTTLATVRQSMLSLSPKPLVEDACSVMLVESLFRARLLSRRGESRFLAQLECYVRLAEQLLSEGKPEEAREQLRHIFGRAPGLMREGHFASQVFIVLKRCYSKLGDTEMAERCAAEARRCAIATAAPTPILKRAPSGLSFSVIVPTYNRLPILKKCLNALEMQTLNSTEFEVIVIDDGSSDGTEELLTHYRAPFRLQYLRQENSGTGAARRNGVAHASGEYLLLMNDDTICDRDLLQQHLQVQRGYPGQRWAVLGNFEYPAAARLRALTRYFCVDPFMFPQVSMEDACPYGYSHFITCNLSVSREAVVEAGSFDPIYKLSEDTELGIRLFERGYRVLYHPEAYAFHDHLPYPAHNLIRRARVYGADYFYMFGKHPRVMQEWAMPVKLTAMDEENAMRILSYVEKNRDEVEEAVTALERWDAVDFEPILTDQGETAAMVLGLFRQAVPAIHWFYLFETMLHTMIRELGLKHLAAERPVLQAARGAGG